MDAVNDGWMEVDAEDKKANARALIGLAGYTLFTTGPLRFAGSVCVSEIVTASGARFSPGWSL